MSQHFLLSAKTRTLSVRKVMKLTNAQAFEVFIGWRKMPPQAPLHQTDFASGLHSSIFSAVVAAGVPMPVSAGR